MMLDRFRVIFHQSLGHVDFTVDISAAISINGVPLAAEWIGIAKVNHHFTRPLLWDWETIYHIAGSIPTILIYGPLSRCPDTIAVASEANAGERFQFSNVTTPLFCPILFHGVVQEWIILMP